jgi:hypothetical protein
MVSRFRAALSTRIGTTLGPVQPQAVDPERIKNFISLIMQFLPIILAFFKAPNVPTPPAPVQAGAPITTLEGLLEFVDKMVELHALTEEQQQIVLNAVEALSAFLTIKQ